MTDEQPHDSTTLLIDFASGATLDGVGRFTALETLRLRHVPEGVVLPDALWALPKLERLGFRGHGGHLAALKGLERFTGALEFEECPVSDLPSLPQAQSLSFETGAPETDVKLLLTKFPNLKALELRGVAGLERRQLTDDVTRFKNLEALTLRSLGLTALPASLSKVRLKQLKLRDLPLERFPEVICQIRSLELLELARIKLAKLPEALSQLTVLRELSLEGVLNQGVARYSSSSAKELKDLPLVIGSLIRLERLRLRRCGVHDAENLQAVFSKLTRLKVVDLERAFVTSLAFLKGNVGLEELLLEGVEKLKSLEGIEGFSRLRHVSLSEAKLPNLEPLKALKALAELEIEGLACKDLSALYELDVKLTADEDVLEKYAARAALRGVPPFDELLGALVTDDVKLLETTLGQLVLRSAGESTRRSALLAVLQGEPLPADVAADEDDDENDEDDDFDDDDDDDDDDEDGSLIELPDFEQVIEQHKGSLAPLTLAKVFGELYRSVRANVPVAVTLAREVAERGDDEAQLQLVEGFKRANEFYEAGHRAYELTPQDLLIDEVFPTLEPAALTALVTWADNEALDADGLDGLFSPALERGTDEQRTKTLERLERFLSALTDKPKRVMKTLGPLLASTTSVVRAAAEALKTRLDAKARADATRVLLKEELRDDDIRVVVRALDAVLEMTGDEATSLRSALRSAAENRALPLSSATRLMRWQKAQPEEPNRFQVTFLQAAVTHGVDALRPVAQALGLEGLPLATMLRSLARKSFDPSSEEEAVLLELTRVQLRAWASSVDPLPAATEASNDVRDAITSALANYDSSRFVRALDGLTRVEKWVPSEIPAKADDDDDDDDSTGDIDWGSFADVIVEAASSGEEQWPQLKSFVRQLHKLSVPGAELQRILAQLLAVCSQGKDEEGVAIALRLVPSPITNDILAFNVAGVTALAGKRDEALVAMRRALELGKPPSQFRSDTDFKKLKKDPDFVALLAEFSN